MLHNESRVCRSLNVLLRLGEAMKSGQGVEASPREPSGGYSYFKDRIVNTKSFLEVSVIHLSVKQSNGVLGSNNGVMRVTDRLVV